MFNTKIITAGTLILSMLVLIAATQIDKEKVNEQDRNHHTLSGIVVDADTEDGIPNATVTLKKSNGEDGMHADRTQQDHQQHQEGVTRTDDEESKLDSTTTDHNGEFEFENLAEYISGAATHGADRQAQDQTQHDQDQNDERFILVVEADGYETEEKEFNLSDYIDRADHERTAMDRDQDRDRDQHMDRDREDKDKDKLKIELTPENGTQY